MQLDGKRARVMLEAQQCCSHLHIHSLHFPARVWDNPGSAIVNASLEPCAFRPHLAANIGKVIWRLLGVRAQVTK